MKLIRNSIVVFMALLMVSCQDTEPSLNVPKNLDKSLLLKLVNKYRASGCTCQDEHLPPVGTLSWNNTLELVARKHSDDMNKNNFFAHRGSDGSSGGARISRLGYAWSKWGENIAKDQTTEEEVIKSWINSKAHCKTIMNAGFKEMGIARSGSYWTQVFATK